MTDKFKIKIRTGLALFCIRGLKVWNQECVEDAIYHINEIRRTEGIHR